MKVKIDFQLFLRKHLRVRKNVNLRGRMASTNVHTNFFASDLMSRQC